MVKTPTLDELIDLFSASDTDCVEEDDAYERNARALELELTSADYSAIDVPQLLDAYAAQSFSSVNELRQATVVTLRAIRGSSFSLSDTLVLLSAYAKSYGDAFTESDLGQYAIAITQTFRALSSESDQPYGVLDAVALVDAYGQNAGGDADAYDVTDLQRATCMTLDVLQRTKYRTQDAVTLIELYNRFSSGDQDIDDLADATHHTLSALHLGEFHIDDALGLIRAYDAATRDGTNESVEESAAALRSAVCKTLKYVRTHTLDLPATIDAIEAAPEQMRKNVPATDTASTVRPPEPPHGLLTRLFGIGAPRSSEPAVPIYEPINVAAVCDYVLNLPRDSLQTPGS